MFATHGFSSYMPAYPHRTANPWPADAWRAMERYVAQEVQRLEWCWEKARKHPALDYCENKVPGESFCVLSFRYANYDAELDAMRQELRAMREEWRAKKKPLVAVPVDQRSPLLKWTHKQLDRLSAWWHGPVPSAAPDWFVFSKSPIMHKESRFHS
jgi:hypothetical protein